MRALAIMTSTAFVACHAAAQDIPTYEQMNAALRIGAASYELPQQIDPTTRLIDVNVEGLTMTLHYEVSEHGSEAQMRRFFAENNLKAICADDNSVYSFRQGVVFRYSYKLVYQPMPVVVEVSDGDCDVALIAPTAEPAMGQEAPDWRVFIDEADWTFVGESEGVVSLARRQPTNSRVVEFRYEYEDDGFARGFPLIVEAFPAYLQARSMTAVAEIDCEGRRRRSLRETIYPGRNLSGDAILTREMNRAWIAIEPSTVGFDQFEWACSANR